jgi:polysaccharide transporter, PST family
VQGLSGSINGLILGSVAPVAALGEYAGAERITRVFQQGMWPVNQALYPKLTHQIQNDPNRAIKTVRLSLLLLGVLGSAFKNSVPVLRVFSLWIPLIALCTVIIFQLLLPNHLDKQFNFVNVTAALLGIISTLLLAHRYKALGVAWSAVAVQLYTLVAFSLVAWRAGLNPFARATDVSGSLARPAVLARESSHENLP